MKCGPKGHSCLFLPFARLPRMRDSGGAALLEPLACKAALAILLPAERSVS